MMKKIILCCSLWGIIFLLMGANTPYRKLYISDYRDKAAAGWLGQIVGVSWGAPTEFKWCDKIIPETEVPQWKPEMINDAFNQDDLYVEMTFLHTLEKYGLHASIRQAGIDFANSLYQLWCANNAGRNNLRKGIAPPDSGHPRFNPCPNDIDYQIEADFSGLIAPGLPNQVIALGDKFGRLMNYSDGIYGGMFVGGMYTEAFFTEDLFQIIDAGLACIPANSQYAEMVRDMLAWYRENPDDWKVTWEKCQEKYRRNPKYQKCSNGGIDVKINGAYILLGMLYGKGNLEDTILISMRAGQDSDCNPSNAAGVLFTTLGKSQLPSRYTAEMNNETKFSYTAYNFPKLLDVCEKLARQTVLAAGGKIGKDEKGEFFLIPVQKACPLPLELSWAPGPIANSRFTEDEMAQIHFRVYLWNNLQEGVDRYFSGWKAANCGDEMNPGIFYSQNGKSIVLKTHPLNPSTPCTLSREVTIAKDSHTSLQGTVSAYAKYDWKLVVRVDGNVALEQIIDGKTEPQWKDFSVDLTSYAGKTIQLTVENVPNDWHCEAGYWSRLEIVTE